MIEDLKKNLSEIIDLLVSSSDTLDISKQDDSEFVLALKKLVELEASLIINSNESDQNQKKIASDLLKLSLGKKNSNVYLSDINRIGNCRQAVDKKGRTYYVQMEDNKPTGVATYNNDICFKKCYEQTDPNNEFRPYYINAKTGQTFWDKQECDNTMTNTLPDELTATPYTINQRTMVGAGISNDVDLLVEKLNNSESSESLPELLSDTPSSEILN